MLEQSPYERISYIKQKRGREKKKKEGSIPPERAV